MFSYFCFVLFCANCEASNLNSLSLRLALEWSEFRHAECMFIIALLSLGFKQDHHVLSYRLLKRVIA